MKIYNAFVSYSSFVLFLLLLSSNSYAQIPGHGCNLGSEVYNDYLGYTNGKYYYANTTKIDIWTNSGNTGYKCGLINVYPASQYWDGSKIVQIPAEDEIKTRSTSSNCVVANTLGGSPIRWGSEQGRVEYSIYNPDYCGGRQTSQLPIDSNWVILTFSGVFIYFLKNKIALLSHHA